MIMSYGDVGDSRQRLARPLQQPAGYLTRARATTRPGS
jgi:hypothetical protein